MTLTDLAREGKFKNHKTNKAEISQLLALFQRDMADAQIVNLSVDRRFATAYNAALMVSIAALAVSGYRAPNEGHHYWTIQSLAYTLGIDANTIETFSRFRQKRNISDYERIGLISKAEASEMLELATGLRILFEGWLRKDHPDLVPGK
jgi:hypothetical protein